MAVVTARQIRSPALRRRTPMRCHRGRLTAFSGPILALALGLVAPNIARASITFQYVTDQSSYTAANAGDTVSVQVFLQETDIY